MGGGGDGVIPVILVVGGKYMDLQAPVLKE